MTQFIRVKYNGMKGNFSENFLSNLIQSLLPGCSTVETVNGPEVDIKKTSLASVIKLFYNDGQGGSLYFNLKDFHFGVCAVPQKTGIELVISIDHHMLLDRRIGEQVAAEFIKRATAIYNCVNPDYAIGDWEEIIDRKGITYKSEVFWINFYGPEIVRKIGREKFATIPYGTIEDLANGGMLLLRGRAPDENSEHREGIREHLFGKRSLIDRVLKRHK